MNISSLENLSLEVLFDNYKKCDAESQEYISSYIGRIFDQTGKYSSDPPT
ncbi:unnamed protein product, partial [marine sediment metagenome]